MRNALDAEPPGVVIDRVDHPERAPTRRPRTFELEMQRLTHPVGFLCHGPEDELDDGTGDLGRHGVKGAQRAGRPRDFVGLGLGP